MQDVRATEKDKVKIGDCFRGGDVVRGVVVGDLRFDATFHLTTFQSYPLVIQEVIMLRRQGMILGSSSQKVKQVILHSLPYYIFLTLDIGATMVPISWQEMRCPKTGVIEKRKCARPDVL